MTYWGFQHAVPLAGRRTAFPPLGLISVAACLPRDWEYRLVDLNARPLADADILWADAVLTGGMRIQGPSIHEVVRRAARLERLSVVGGPCCYADPDEYADADLVFVGEIEGREAQLVEAMRGARPGASLRIDAPTQRPDVGQVPIPRFDLLRMEDYASMSLQYSRGCPFLCEFCDIIEIFGRRPRSKSPQQVIRELSALHELGWRGAVFFVDDNFIGNKPAVKELLPEVAAWQSAREFPFDLYTEASVNLAADEALVDSMVDAGFSSVFLGLESPSPDSLVGAAKKQNLRMDMGESVQRLITAGLEVMGGFIVGFDEDSPAIFELQRRFIMDAGIPLAMVGLLGALPGTQLWRRLEREGRLRHHWDGDNFDRPNFDPAMDEETLLVGYRRLLAELYSPEAYYARCRSFIDRAPGLPGRKVRGRSDFVTVGRTIVAAGMLGEARGELWKLAQHTVRRAPQHVRWMVAKAVHGEHMLRYTRELVLPRLSQAIADVRREQARARPRTTTARARRTLPVLAPNRG